MKNTMKNAMSAGMILCTVIITGCVSSGTHEKALAELDQTRKAMETSKKQASDQIAALQKDLGENKKALEEANGRMAALEKEKSDQTRELTTKLEAAQAQVAALQSEKEKLLSGTTTAQEEIARLQKQAGELEMEKARSATLAKLVSERDEQLKAEAAEKARLEQEHVAKEAEVQRLSKTQEDLAKSLEAEIAKGDIRIKQVRDRLTINMVDRVLFDSGQGQVKPAGLKVLKQVADILKNVTDKQVRIEGHTDNVPIGGALKEKYPTNWELSTARATSVVRYLIEEGGVDRANLSAVGYADTRPVAGNSTEEGRKANRRIEITLYPKDLSEIASQIKP